MQSEMRLCRFLTAFHAWKPPKLESKIVRIRFGQCRAQQGPAALFFERVCSIVYCSLPRQLFSGWHCDPGSQSDNGILCYIGNDSDGARSASLARPDGRVLGDRRRLSFPLFSLSHKDQTVHVQRVDRGRTHSFASSSRAQWRRLHACLVERCTGLAPQFPPGPCPTSLELTGLGVFEGFGSWRRRMANPDALRFTAHDASCSTAPSCWNQKGLCSRDLLSRRAESFVLRVLTTAWRNVQGASCKDGTSCVPGRVTDLEISNRPPTAITRFWLSFLVCCQHLCTRSRANAPQRCTQQCATPATNTMLGPTTSAVSRLARRFPQVAHRNGAHSNAPRAWCSAFPVGPMI